MRVLLIRHGTSTWNAEQRWQGWADPPLSADGIAQAEAAAAALRGLDIHIVVSSDLARARSTAEIIAGGTGVELSIEPALRERNIGLWTGLTSAEVESRWPGQLERYRADPEIPFPDGEEAGAMIRRAIPVLLTIARQDPQDGVAVVVSHGGLIRCVRLALGGTDRPVPQLAGCWLEARDNRLRLVAGAEVRRDPS
jgi:broad specificity phosphatase PhoE